MESWQSFYVIIGSAGAALIGIQFVVVTLVASMRRRPPMESFSAFGTPTVLHLSGALLVSAVMTAPWPSIVAVSRTLTACGLAGLVYCGIVIRRTLRQTYYVPVWQDWLWFSFCPISLCATLTVGAVLLRTRTYIALFVIAAAALGLLLMAIRNAWDSVTHLIVIRGDDEDETRVE